MTAYMTEFLVGSEFTVIDLSEIFTYSDGVNATMLGHNQKDEYIPQINLALHAKRGGGRADKHLP